MNPADQFRSAIRGAGLAPPDDIVADGRIHRFSTNGRRSDDAGWYVLFPDSVPSGAFGNWRTGMQTTFRADVGRPLSAQEVTIHTERMLAAQRERDAILEDARRAAAETAKARWESAQPANGHAYLKSKGVSADGVREIGGELLIPIRDTAGEIINLQRILPDGKKLFLKGGKVAGGHYLIGLPVTSRLVICEGYATGASIHEATSLPVCIAFNAGNLEPVARAMRAMFPAASITIAADNDAWTEGNPGVTAARAAAAAIGADVVVPTFADASSKPTDFNDLVRLQGVESVREVFADRPANALPIELADSLTDDALSIPQLVEDSLTAGGLSVVYGESNSGKTYIVIDMACAVARGVEWLGKRTVQGGVLYVAGEGAASVRMRLLAYKRHHGIDRLPVAIVPISVNLLDANGDTCRVIEAAQAAGRLLGMPVSLIVIDTLARAMGSGNENASEDMGAVVAHADHIRAQVGAHLSFIHHSGKDASKGARGSSVLRAAVDTEVEVVADQINKVHTATFTKQRDLSSRGESFTTRFVALDFGVDQWGKPQKVCIVTKADAATLPVINLMSAHQRAFLMVAKSGQRYDVVRTAFYRTLPPDTKPDARQKAFVRVAKWARESGFFRVEDDILIRLDEEKEPE